MTALPRLKARVKTNFPARVTGGSAISVTKSAGEYTIDFDVDELAETETISSSNADNFYIPVYDSQGDVFSKLDIENLTGAVALNLQVSDAVFAIQDNSDATKQIKFQASGITTGTTRNLTAPDADGTIAVSATSPITLNSSTGDIGVTGAALTKTDDTNVTIALGGSPSSALLAAASLTVGWTGTLAADRLNANVVQSVVNDTNVTGSISAQALTLGWTGTLANSRLATMAAYTLKGNDSGSTASPGDIDIAGLTTKASPASGDYLLLSDQAASGAFKKVTVSSIASAGSVSSIAGNTGAFTLSGGISNTVNDIHLAAIANGKYLANTSGSSAEPVATDLPTLHHQEFTTSGTFTTDATIASGTLFKITVVGAGGGAGGNSNASNNAGGGGGGGGACAVYYTTLSPSTGYTVTVGAGGSGGNTSGTNGTAGGSSTFVNGVTTVTAGGGAGGTGAAGVTIAAPGAGGTATNGTVNVTGGDGGWGMNLINSASSVAISQGGYGGAAACHGSIASGKVVTSSGSNGDSGHAYGSGGSGGAGVNTAATGGSGANGFVLIEWVQ